PTSIYLSSLHDALPICFHIDFVDINETIIDALKERKEYDIGYAAKDGETIHIDNVNGLNNGKEPEAVVEAIKSANIVTTAIGPKDRKSTRLNSSHVSIS